MKGWGTKRMSKEIENINNQLNVIANAVRTQFRMGSWIMDTIKWGEV